MVSLPGQTSIDLTPDVIAAMTEQNSRELHLKSDHNCGESNENDSRRFVTHGRTGAQGRLR
jgi:hypothetical protein